MNKFYIQGNLMRTLPDLNILAASNKAGLVKGIKSGKGTGKDFFQSILDSINGKQNSSNWVSTLYSNNSTKKAFNSGLNSGFNNIIKNVGSAPKNFTRKIEKEISSENMIVPASLQNQLVAFLEKQGFSFRDISSALSASKNKNGLIQLDKLLTDLSASKNSNGIIQTDKLLTDLSASSTAGNPGNTRSIMLVKSFKKTFSSFLSGQGIDPNNYSVFFSDSKNSKTNLTDTINNLLSGVEKDNSFIDSSQVPKVQESLFKIGLGVGEVKKIIEKSKNRKGELELAKLSAEINKSLPGALSKSDIASLLSENNINIDKRLFSNENHRTDLKSLLVDSKGYLKDDAQQEIKTNIETMLKEKNISEENIKSVLEKINTVFTKMDIEKGEKSLETGAVSKKILSMIEGDKQVISRIMGDTVKQDIAAFLKKRGSSDKDVKSFLDSFSLDIKKANIGQGENTVKSSMLNDKAFGFAKYDQLLSKSDQGNLKLNLTEIVKLAGQKVKTSQLSTAAEGAARSAEGVKSAPAAKNRSEFIIKETHDVSGLHISQDKEIKSAVKINQTASAASLPDPLPKVIDKIMIMMRTGEYKSRLQITPPDLGKLDIDLTFKNGHIQANLSAENAAVKEIIEANLNQLKQQLNNQGLTVDKFEVMVGLENGKKEENSAWAERRNGKGSGRRTKTISDNPGEMQTSPHVNKGLINDSQVDVHV